MNKKCHSFGTNNDIDIKLGPVTKLDTRKPVASRQSHDYVIWTNYDVIVIFSIMADLEQSESQIPDALSVIPTFSFILQKLKTEKSLLLLL